MVLKMGLVNQTNTPLVGFALGSDGVAALISGRRGPTSDGVAELIGARRDGLAELLGAGQQAARLRRQFDWR